MLMGWVHCLKAATRPEVRHLVYFVGEKPPEWWSRETDGTNIHAEVQPESPGRSIGHYHNLGAASSTSEWIMKLDVDTIPNTMFFFQLLQLLEAARPKEWFNAGMLLLSKSASARIGVALDSSIYNTIMSVPRLYTTQNGSEPQGSNFVCRRAEYLELGGCLPEFMQYGWEDYQVLYMLERHFLGADPLPGLVNFDNVSQRCRDEISRRKARELHARCRSLVLLHKNHPIPEDPAYRSREGMDRNKRTLLGYIERARGDAAVQLHLSSAG